VPQSAKLPKLLLGKKGGGSPAASPSVSPSPPAAQSPTERSTKKVPVVSGPIAQQPKLYSHLKKPSYREQRDQKKMIKQEAHMQYMNDKGIAVRSSTE
jgi:hypothetical protein